MINKELFFKKHNHLQPEYLEKITHTVIKTFPRKLENLKVHMENLNYGEALYFADLIENSFVFIYGDAVLGKLLKQIYEAANKKDKAGLQKLYPLLLEAAAQFQTEVEQLYQDEFANSQGLKP